MDVLADSGRNTHPITAVRISIFHPFLHCIAPTFAREKRMDTVDGNVLFLSRAPDNDVSVLAPTVPMAR